MEEDGEEDVDRARTSSVVIQHKGASKRGGGQRLNDQDAEEFILRVISDLLHWRTPLLSGLWFSTLFLVFFLTFVSGYPLISLICYVILLQLGFTWALMRIAPILSQVGILRSNFDPKTFALQRQAFSVDELKIVSQGLGSLSLSLSNYWFAALTTNDARKLLTVTGFFFSLAIVGKIVPFETVLFTVFLICFSLPPLYDLQQQQFDDFYYMIKDKVDPTIDFLAEKLERFLPESDDVNY